MTSLHLQRALFSLLGLLPLAHASAEGFIDDSKLKLQLRNVYFNENFRDEHGMSAKSARTAKSERTEWAQGVLLDYQSGFTPGTIGFGVDALGLFGVKLDSGRGRSGTGLLPVHNDGRAADEFASLGMTAKAQMAKTTVKYGTLLPKTPVLIYNDARLLPQTYQGTQISSVDIENLTLTGATWIDSNFVILPAACLLCPTVMAEINLATSAMQGPNTRWGKTFA